MVLNTAEITLREMSDLLSSTWRAGEANGFTPVFLLHCNRKIGCRRVLRQHNEASSGKARSKSQMRDLGSNEPCSGVLDWRDLSKIDQIGGFNTDEAISDVSVILLPIDETSNFNVPNDRPVVRLKVIAEFAEWVADVALPSGVDAQIITFLELNPGLFDATAAGHAQGDVIAPTPFDWEAADGALRSFSDHSKQRLLLTGILGVDIAEQFLEFAGRVAGTVCVKAILKAKGTKRKALYPRSTEALTFLIYRLVEVFDEKNARDVITTLSELGGLNRSIHGGGNSQAWLSDLVAGAFQHVLTKARVLGMEQVFLDHPAYARFMSDHRLSLRQNREPEPDRAD